MKLYVVVVPVVLFLAWLGIVIVQADENIATQRAAAAQAQARCEADLQARVREAVARRDSAELDRIQLALRSGACSR